MPHMDAQKIFDLFTEAEARRARKLIRDKREGSLRVMIVKALQRAETMPLAAFVSTKRERIILRTGPAGEIIPSVPRPPPAPPSPLNAQREG